MELSQRIISARQQKGLTQEELAERSGLSIRTVQRIESGESVPRSFTLKALAGALEQSYEQLTVKETPTPDHPAPDARHFLLLFNLSCFACIIIPWGHFLVPYYLLKKRSQLDEHAMQRGRKIVRQQVYWVITLHLLLLLTFAYNFFQVSIFHQPQYFAHYLWPVFIMYFLNAALILVNALLIRKEFN
ncbi:helix-turn-helix transcriptional regulator [uncultured Chitinophaga sp.]|uniref:helix-turn-helix domain-containing protein n=1 Tax=uncultured Chitinophaga sp. TaxID=339340 RepID=UPI002611EE1C|nr:helix-turn-helix transcriptional regulator [uncultured Chitinophaga sp.]